MGPYALLKPLRNGHYKRIVDAKPPEIFKHCRACVESSLNYEEDVVELEHSRDTAIYSDFSEGVFGDSDSTLFYKVYTKNVENEDAQEPEHIDDNGGELEQKDSEVSIVDANISSQPTQGLETDDVTQEYDLRKSENEVENERLSQFGNVAVDFESDSLFKGEGVPTLFYTKSRVKPALLFLSIDYDMQVVYMSKKSISRFFPVKLVQRITTSPDVIQDEFCKHLEVDPLMKLECMVLFNATNFTDSVAVQFSHEKIRDKFVEEVNQIKKLVDL